VASSAPVTPLIRLAHPLPPPPRLLPSLEHRATSREFSRLSRRGFPRAAARVRLPSGSTPRFVCATPTALGGGTDHRGGPRQRSRREEQDRAQARGLRVQHARDIVALFRERRFESMVARRKEESSSERSIASHLRSRVTTIRSEFHEQARCLLFQSRRVAVRPCEGRGERGGGRKRGESGTASAIKQRSAPPPPPLNDRVTVVAPRFVSRGPRRAGSCVGLKQLRVAVPSQPLSHPASRCCLPLPLPLPFSRPRE